MLPICLHIFSGSRLALSTPFLSILFSLYFFIILSLSVSFHPIEHSFHFNCLPNSHSFSFLSALSLFPLPIPLFFPSWYFTQWQLTFLADAFFSLLAFFSTFFFKAPFFSQSLKLLSSIMSTLLLNFSHQKKALIFTCSELFEHVKVTSHFKGPKQNRND